MTLRTAYFGGLLILAGFLLVLVPYVANAYAMALGISFLYFTVLATAWALFSGPTRYISLATAAFFGIGAYTVAICGELMPYPMVLLTAACIGTAVALVVGLSTLRLSGIYFVIFTFGLAELIRQVVTWYEVNIHGSVGRYIFIDVSQRAIYWQLLGLATAVLTAAFVIGRSRLGLAMRVIGEDETVAKHIGINTTSAKLTGFAVSSAFMTIAGAILAPRWTYIDPTIAFNPMLSFQVVIMALLGGAGALLGPLLGVIPLVLLFDVLSANFPNYFSLLLGLVFLLIVYLLPSGVAGLLPYTAGQLPSQRSGAREYVPDARGAGRLKSSTPLLTIQNVTKRFGGLVAVDNLSFSVNQGEIVGLIGPNGSGKTTMLNMISGALKPDAGAITFRDTAIGGCSPHLIARGGIARTFQLVRVLPGLTVVENVLTAISHRKQPLLGAEAYAAALALLKRVGLEDRAAVLADELTYIDQKRLELARALGLQPDLLLLDEWLAGLNPTELIEGVELIRSLQRDGVTILLVEHVMHAIRTLCTRCIVMSAGSKIADAPPVQALSDPEVVRAYLGDADA